MFKLFATSSALVAAVSAHIQEPLKQGPHKGLWYNTLPGDGGTQAGTEREETSGWTQLKVC